MDRGTELTQVGGAGYGMPRRALSPARVGGIVRTWDTRAIAGWVLAFLPVLLLGADSGGYWPTAWGWTALLLLFVCAVILLARGDVRLSPLEAALPLGLLALTAWGCASALWSASATQPLLQSQRTLMYAAAALAALLVVRRATYRALLNGAWAATTCICGYSLLTRLFPERLGSFDSLADYRLEAPLGYWNVLAIFAALGTLLAAGFAARGHNPFVRALAAASTVILVPALYFTFSRGGWIALAVGLATMIALDARRLQLVTALAVVAPWPALAVWHASGSAPLTHLGGTLAAAEHSGHRYTLYLAVMMLAAAAAAALYSALEPRVHVPGRLRTAYAIALLLVLAAAIGAATDRYGSPLAIARHGYRSIVGQAAPASNGDLNKRLLSLSLNGRVPQFRVAWREYLAHPWLGSGEGSYERYWDEYRTSPSKIKNVHNLYLETLAELGPVGLVLLLLALGAPLVAAFKARRRSLAAAAAGAYVAFLAHAAVDWDWQMPAVTLVALFCGVALLVSSRGAPSPLLGPAARATAAAVVIALGVIAFVGLKGNLAIASSEDATAHANFTKAASEARDARSWAPWSATPLQLLGEAQAAMGNKAAARKSFGEALAKNRQDWSIWLDLAVASKGVARRQAFAAATRLNPLSPEIASWKTPGGGSG
jgi:O-Antigen ligase